jgi:hypothetical protein
MTRYLNANGICIFDYPEFAKTPRARPCGIAGRRSGSYHRARREAACPQGRCCRARAPAAWRPPRSGAHHLGHGCLRCLQAGARQADTQDLHPAGQRHLHYYFYVQDAELGRVYLRVPTRVPFRWQVYCNGHSWLARKLTANGVGYTMADNAFARIADWALAQALADTLSPDQLHRNLDQYAKPGIRCVRAVLSTEPDAGGIRHRSGVPLHRHARPAL